MSAHHSCAPRLVFAKDVIKFRHVVHCYQVQLALFLVKPSCQVCRGVYFCSIKIELHECTEIDVIFVDKMLVTAILISRVSMLAQPPN